MSSEQYITIRTLQNRLLCSSVVLFMYFAVGQANALEFDIRRVSDARTSSRDPVISATGKAAWTYFDTNKSASAYSHIALYDAATDTVDNKSLLLFVGASKLHFQSNHFVFVASYFDSTQKKLRRPSVVSAMTTNRADDAPPLPSADIDSSDSITYDIGALSEQRKEDGSGGGDLTTVWLWNFGEKSIQRMPCAYLSNVGPSHWNNLTAWQWEQDWPFGYEIMFAVNGNFTQLTTNKFYDLAPQVHGEKIVWFGWDGYDYEIYQYDAIRNEITQITDNRFDDTAPQIWNDVIVWEGYAGVEADIYMWKEGQIKKISDNLDDDLYPQIWDKYIVWQGYDGDDFEVYLYDVEKNTEAVKITSNNFDDTNPKLHDNVLTWMGYHDNWDSEVYATDLRDLGTPTGLTMTRLTENDVDDRDPATAAGYVIWVTEESGFPQIMLAKPR